jgi:hypothetical protein
MPFFMILQETNLEEKYHNYPLMSNG